MKKHLATVGYLVGLAAVAALACSHGYRASAADKSKALCHVVLFELKDSAPADEVKALIADGHALLGKVPSVQEMHTGRPAEDSKVANDKGYGVALYARFADAKGLAEYLEHPRHLEYVDKHKNHWSKVRIIDFWSE